MISTRSDPVSRDSGAAVLNADRSEMVLEGKSVVSETTLERTLIAEETIDSCVMGTKVASKELRVSDGMAGSGVTDGESVVGVITSVGR